MGYQNLQQCLRDLEATGQLRRIEIEVDPKLEMALIQRRVYAAGGPALLFQRVKGCRFPAVSNLFGTLKRSEFLFRDAIEGVRRLVALKVDPSDLAKNWWKYRSIARVAWNTRPKWRRSGPILQHQTTIDQLPPIQSWPNDGGPFVTLPQVYTEDPRKPGVARSNLGMYRVQLSGNQYELNQQIGMHYQIHRGIGVHHAAALEQKQPLRVNIFVGGPPAMTVSAVMPLPENLSELTFAGALGGRRLELVVGANGLPIPAEADFCISGTIDMEQTLPEGPFGDHLGYYSLAHDFPVLKVDRVYHRPDAVWPFTVVGRPPQEDTSFGAFIHELTGPVIPTVVHGVHAVHAVDAAGVHPLLLAIGSERYVPYQNPRRPQELLTCANAILGQGQLSLAKFLFITAREDDPSLDIHDIEAFLRHLLQRVDWQTDLHFQTCTTIDTLDYSGSGLNQGSKLVIAAAGPRRRELPTELPAGLTLPSGFSDPQVVLPGIVAITAPPFAAGEGEQEASVRAFLDAVTTGHPLNEFPLVLLVDDSPFVAATRNNFLWAVFTRSNPAADVHGVGAFVHQKHWGCRGSLVIDARIKPHHAPPLEEDPEVVRRVESLAASGGPLHGLF